MKTLEELAPEIDAGKLAILVWSGLDAFAFRDQEQYVLSSPTHKRVWTVRNAGSAADLIRCVDEHIDDQDQAFLTGNIEDEFEERHEKKPLRLLKYLVQMPLWTAIDPTMPGVDGVSLLSLREDLERGETAYCLLDDKEYPYHVMKNKQGEVWFVAPSPMNDILAQYESLDSLFASYFRAHLPIWQKGTSPAYRAIEEQWERDQDEEEESAPDTIPLAFRQAFDDQPAADPQGQLVQASREDDNEDQVPLDSHLGQDASALLAHYFPGATITSIQSIYHRGYFIGDYSISMICTVAHPIVEQVKMGFSHEDVPGRPPTWRELCSLRVDLYLTSFTLLNRSNGHPMTYELPRGLWQKEIEEWCKTLEHGSLYGHIQTPDLFIITTEKMSEREELKRALLEAASDSGEEEKPANVIPLAFRRAFEGQSPADPREQQVGGALHSDDFDPFLDDDKLP